MPKSPSIRPYPQMHISLKVGTLTIDLTNKKPETVQKILSLGTELVNLANTRDAEDEDEGDEPFDEEP